MNSHRLIILFMAGAISISLPALTAAQAVKVLSADPPTAEQGTQNLNVTIGGQGFEKGAKVFFYPTGTTEPGGILVGKTFVVDAQTIIVNIDIEEVAETVDYDIEVQLSRGRGGKGTTLFNVQEKKTIFTCDEVFGLDSSVCDCTFSLNSEGGQGTPTTWIWIMQDNCTTQATLRLPSFEALSTLHGEKVLTAGAPFSGSSVVANAGHRAQAFILNVEIAAGVDAGCGPGQLNSAIGFVLDGDSVSPATTDHDGRVYPNTRLRTWGITIDHEPGAAALCHGIDFRREPAYDAKYPPTDWPDAQAHVQDVLVTAGTYSRSAIRVAGFTPAEGGGRAAVTGIRGATIMPGAGAGAAGLEFGPVYGPGEVLENVVTAAGGVGLRVYGSGVDDLTLRQNNVTGAQTAILVDDQASQVLFKSNVLTGDGPGGVHDTGICTDAAANTFGPNRIEDFDIDIQEGGCAW